MLCQNMVQQILLTLPHILAVKLLHEQSATRSCVFLMKQGERMCEQHGTPGFPSSTLCNAASIWQGTPS